MAGGMMAEQQQVLQQLVQEAQEEIGNLRAELYSQRRLAEERRQALDAMTTARDQLAAVAHQLEGQVQASQAQVAQLPQLQLELQNLQELHQRLQKDCQVQLQARRILESELQDERAGRSAAEEARAKAESERTRLQLAQDDLLAQLRVARHKAAEAEEEQLRAEEDAAVLRRELQLLQSGAQPPSASPAAAAAAAGGQQWDAQALHAELQAQQERCESLMQALSGVQSEAAAAKAEAKQLQLQLSDAQAQARHHEQQAAQLQASLLQQGGRQQGGDPTAQELAQQLAALQVRADGADKQLAAAKQQTADMQQALAAAESRAAQAQAQARAEAARAAAAASSVPGGPPASDEATVQLEDQVELLMAKLVALKKSRDKMLAQLDTQSLESEQLSLENQALSESVVQAQEQSKLWQAQAQEALSTISRLQDLLAESSSWEATAASANHAAAASGPAPGDAKAAARLDDSGGSNDGGAASSVAAAGAELHAALLREQARAAQLELQVRVLSVHLVRVFGAYRATTRSLVPILSQVEGKLLAAVKM